MEREGSEKSPLRRKIYKEFTESDGRVFGFIASNVWSKREDIGRKKSVNKWKQIWAKEAIELKNPFVVPSGEGEAEITEIANYLSELSILQIRGTKEVREAELERLSLEALNQVKDETIRRLLLNSAKNVLTEYVGIVVASRHAVTVRALGAGANKEKG